MLYQIQQMYQYDDFFRGLMIESPWQRLAEVCLGQAVDAKNMQHFTDPANPYDQTGGFVYQRELTGHGFGAMRFIIRVMCLDLHDELKSAWKKLAKAGEPDRASKIFSDTTRVSYQNAMGGISKQISEGKKVEKK